MPNYPSGAEMLLKGKRVKDGVEYILRKYPQTRGDYRQLDWRYCREFTGIRISFSEFVQLRACPSFETIHRRYREIVADDSSLKPSHRVQNKRYNLQEAYKHNYGKGLTLMDYLGAYEVEE